MTTPEPYDPYDPYALAWEDWAPHPHFEDPAEGVDGQCKDEGCQLRRWYVSQLRIRRRITLGKLRKAEVIARYRQLGGLGGMYPPEKWRKDEVVTSVAEMEEQRNPAGFAKLAAPATE